MRELSTAVRWALMAGGAIASLPALQAQGADAPSAAPGSRLPSARRSAAPLTVISREQIERSGAATLGALLQQQPWSGPAPNTRLNSSGDGSTQFSLWGSGPQRLVVLVDGRRWIGAVPGAGGVDLDSIPLATVERIEVLREEASAIYGADAVAGAINIVTRRPVGFAVAGALGAFAEGDGQRRTAEVVWGAARGRGAASLIVSHLDSEPVMSRDRNLTADPTFRLGRFDWSSTTPMGRLRVPDAAGELGGAFAVFGLGQTTRDVGGDATPGPEDFRAYDASIDPYNTSESAYLIMPVTRDALRLDARRSLSDAWSLAGAASLERRRTAQQISPYALTLGAPGLAWNGVNIGIEATNPYNFFGLTLSPTAPSAVTNDGVLHLRNLNRRMVELGPRRFEQDGETHDLAVTLDGRWSGFALEAGLATTRATLDAESSGLVGVPELALALGPAAACITPCVPLNLLGGAGSITPAMAEFIGATGHDRAVMESDRAWAVLRHAELFALPAGPSRFAAGIELARERIDDRVDARFATGEVAHSSRLGGSGALAHDDLFVELGVPLAEALDLSLAARGADHDRFALAPQTRLALDWRPVRDLVLYAAWARGARAPTLRELFEDPTAGMPVAIDYCTGPSPVIITPISYGIDYTPDTQDEAQALANCTGQVVTGAFNATPAPEIPASAQVPWGYAQSTVQLAAASGGNADLEPERSASRSLGLRYTPGALEGLALELDARSLRIDDAITDISSVNTLFIGCYVELDTERCRSIERGTTGDIALLELGPANADRFELETWNLVVEQAFGEFAWLPGGWRLRWETAYIESWRLCSPELDGGGSGCAERVQTNLGDAALPRFRSLLTLDWALGAWDASWRARFIGRHYEACTAPTLTTIAQANGWTGTSYCSNPTDQTNALGATTYHALQLGYRIEGWDARIALAVENLFDRSPPVSTQASARSFDASTYEAPGRFIQLALTRSF